MNEIEIIDVKRYEFINTPEIKNKIREKVEMNSKKIFFSFGDWNVEYFLDQFNYLKKKLLEMKNIYKKIEEGKLEPLEFDIRQFKNFINEFINKLNEPSDKEIMNEYKGLEEHLRNISTLYSDLEDIYKKDVKNLIIEYSDLKKHKIFSGNFTIPEIKEGKHIFPDFTEIDVNSSILSSPSISKNNGILKCNYNKLEFNLGPFNPELYSKPLKLKILKFVDSEMIGEITEKSRFEKKEEEKDEEKEEEKEEEIIEEKNEIKDEIKDEDINRKKEEEKKLKKEKRKKAKEDKIYHTYTEKDKDQIKYMNLVKKTISKESKNIEIEIKIPSYVERGKKEIHQIHRFLYLKSGDSECEIKIEMNIFTIPFEILLSCSKYELEYNKEKEEYHLLANKLFYGEEIIFEIQNYDSGISPLKIFPRIESLEKCTCPQPNIDFVDNKLKIKIPEGYNDDIKKLHCKINCHLTSDKYISIIIKSAVFKNNFDLYCFDYLKNKYTNSNYLELLLPKNQDFKINLNFVVILPIKFKGLYVKIKSELESGVYYNDKGKLFHGTVSKKIGLSDISYITMPIFINNAIFNSDIIICTFIFKIPGINIERKITVLKKRFEFNNIYNYFNLDKTLLYYSDTEKVWKRVFNSNQINSKSTFICPYYCWESNKISYCQRANKYYLFPLPENYFEIAIESYRFLSNKIVKLKGQQQYRRIMGLFDNKWVPLFDSYEKENNLFNLDDAKSLKKQTNLTNLILHLSNNYYYSAQEIIYRNLFRVTDIKEPYKKGGFIDFGKIVELLKKNEYRDTYERIKKKTKDSFYNNYTISSFLFEILENYDNIRQVFEWFPNEITEEIKGELDCLNSGANKPEAAKLSLIKKLYKIMNGKFNYLRNNPYIKLEKGPTDEQILEKMKELREPFHNKEIRYIKEEEIGQNSIKKLNQRIEKTILEMNQNNNKEKKKDTIEVKNIKSNKFLIIDKISKKVDIAEVQIKSELDKNSRNQITEAENVDIEDIEMPKYYSVNALIEFFGKCITLTQILPAYIRMAKIKEEQKEFMTKGIQIFNKISNIYRILISNNYSYSIISSKTLEFEKEYRNMISKFLAANANFKNIDFLKNFKEEDYSKTNFIINPKEDDIELKVNEYNIDIEEEVQEYSHMNKKKKMFNSLMSNNIIFNNDSGKMMNYEMNQLSNEKVNKDKEVREIKKIENPKKKPIKPIPIIEHPEPENKEIKKVFEDLSNYMNDDMQIPDEEEENKEIEKAKEKVIRAKESETKIVRKSGADFQNDKNFDIEKEVSRAISKMKQLDKDSKTEFKYIRFSEREGKLVTRYEAKNLDEKVEIPRDSPIYNLVDNSNYLANRLFSVLSKGNLKNEIPFKDLEVYILLDCARTISSTDKFFTMFQVCALTTALYNLEIPYLLSVVGDSGYKVILKELDEEHSYEALQKALDCIMIKRCNTNIASCVKTALEKFSPEKININRQRVFYIFTNGLDEEYKLYSQWKENIFKDAFNCTFAFIFSMSDSLKEDQIKDLKEVWEGFQKACDEQNKFLHIISISKDQFLKDQDILIPIFTGVLPRSIKPDDNSNVYKPILSLNELSNTPSIDNLRNILANDLDEVKEEPYIKKVKLNPLQESLPKQDSKEFKELSKCIGQIMKINNLPKEEFKKEIKSIVKELFKIRKEKINSSLLEIIFKPNLPTQTILTDVGSHIDVNELIKYFLNPTPNPRIYREIGDGYIKNYGVTVVVDSSSSCFGSLSIVHTFSTLKNLFSALASIDLPCFDLIISGEKNPYIICSEKRTMDALSEKSQIWPIFFTLINQQIKNTDLASAIRAAYNLHNSRKTELTDYLFVVTDGLFSLSQIKRIEKNVNFCMGKGLLTFGIGVGVSPYGIEKLFPNIIYSKNPTKLVNGIASCFSEINKKEEMIPMEVKYQDKITPNDIEACQTPIYKKLKDELIHIPVELSGYDFYQGEIPKNADAKDMEVDGKFSIHKFGMYPKNFFKGQKALIVMAYSAEMNNKENVNLSYKYIKNKSDPKNECILSSLEYTGMDIDISINYKDAIEKLLKSSVKGKCDYLICVVMSGPPYEELPNKADNPHLIGEFIKVVIQFWKNGGGLCLFADNVPFTYQTNLFLEILEVELKHKIKFRVGGNHKGENIMNGDDKGDLTTSGTFNRKIQLIDDFSRVPISHSLYKIYEGKTVSYIIEKPIDDEALYNTKNEDLKMITDPKALEPWVPFSKETDGGFNALFYGSNDEKGDIVIDCSYTKFFLEMESQGTPRYIQNIFSWLGSVEKHQMKDGCKDGTDFRPLQVVLGVNYNAKWDRFLKKPVSEFDLVYFVDITGSMGEYLNGVKEYCKDISQKLKNELPNFEFSYGGIFYSDPVDVNTDRNICINLTPDIDKFKDFVTNIQLLDGGDGPEDWYGAYNIAVNQIKWRDGIRCIIHIADAGAHGTDYSPGDRHPGEGPKLDSLIPKCAEMKFQIFGFKIGEGADNSFKRFESIFTSNKGKSFELKVFDKNNNIGANFANMVVDSAKACAA